MIRPSLAVALLALATPCLALDLDSLVAKHSAANGVPETLVRRVIKIESRGQPHLVSKGNYGLMQIRYGTAKAMGYTGTPQGLLDADTNMTYAVRYLAGAYRAAHGNHDRAVRLYQRGYYDVAKAKGFSPYSLASQTSTPADKPKVAKVRTVVVKRDKPVEPTTERPATLQERFAVAMPAAPAASSVKTVATQDKPAVPQEKLAVAPPLRPAVLPEKPAVASPAKPVVPQETLAVVPRDKPAVRHRRAKPKNQPFNLLSYLKTKLAAPAAKPERRYRYRTHRVKAMSRSTTPKETPMISAATPRAQKP